MSIFQIQLLKRYSAEKDFFLLIRITEFAFCREKYKLVSKYIKYLDHLQLDRPNIKINCDVRTTLHFYLNAKHHAIFVSEANFNQKFYIIKYNLFLCSVYLT